MLPSSFIIIGTVINFAGSFGYIIDTARGKIKPNRVSFLLWAIAPLIAFIAQIKQGVGMEALVTLSSAVIPLSIFLTSFVNKKAEWKLTRFDLICGLLSIVGLLLWQITKVGNVAIFFSIVADGLAAIPTIIKSYKYPDTEVAWPWFATVFGVTLALLTIKEFTFANSGFIIYVIVVNFVIFSLVQFRIGEKPGFKGI